MRGIFRWCCRLNILPLLLAALAISSPVAGAENSTSVLSLASFLAQVRQKHEGYAAADLNSRGAEFRAEESELTFRPRLQGLFEYSSDGTPVSGPFPREKTTSRVNKIGIAQTLGIGLEAKVSYLLTHTHVIGSPTPSLYPENGNYYDAKPLLELSMPLWRGFWGAELRAAQTAQEAAAKATSQAERYRATLTLSEAERAYWRLALARRIIEVQRSSLERAQRLRDWQSRRTRLELGDRGDLMQADAAVQLRGLELQSAMDEERSAAQAFNLARGLSSETVVENLEEIDAEQLVARNSLPEYRVRADLVAAEAQSRAAEANARLGIERQAPDVQLYGNASLYGRDPRTSPAVSESFGTRYESWGLGLRIATPLDFGLLERNRAGYRLESEAASLTYKRKELEVQNEWADLQKRWSEAKRRLQLALEIEKIQREKVAYERSRQEKGRSTTFQVITFEQDYAAARVSRLRLANEVLAILTSLKTFGEQR